MPVVGGDWSCEGGGREDGPGVRLEDRGAQRPHQGHIHHYRFWHYHRQFTSGACQEKLVGLSSQHWAVLIGDVHICVVVAVVQEQWAGGEAVAKGGQETR